jgi:hypothetical protein
VAVAAGAARHVRDAYLDDNELLLGGQCGRTTPELVAKAAFGIEAPLDMAPSRAARVGRDVFPVARGATPPPAASRCVSLSTLRQQGGSIGAVNDVLGKTNTM